LPLVFPAATTARFFRLNNRRSDVVLDLGAGRPRRDNISAVICQIIEGVTNKPFEK